MAIPIIFNAIIVNGQKTNATISVGENQQSGWSAHAKQNIGNGMLLGLNYSFNQLFYIFDNDVVDSPIFDNDITTSAQAQAL